MASRQNRIRAPQPPGIPGTEERSQLIDGVRVRYLFAGSGPPLLLIHGLLGYSFSWRYNLEALAKLRSVYAVDLPGTGFSERNPELLCGMQPSAERLWRFLDSKGIGRTDILATSHGGALGMYMAAAAPDRVNKLVLVAPANPWSRFGRHLIWAFRNTTGAAAMRAGAPTLLRFGQYYFLARLYGDRSRISPGTVEGYSAPLHTPGTIEYGLEVVRTWRHDMDHLATQMERLARLHVLLVWGSKDRAVDPRSAYKLQKQLPNNELHILQGVGHLPYEEQPAEFNQLVCRFLAAS